MLGRKIFLSLVSFILLANCSSSGKDLNDSVVSSPASSSDSKSVANRDDVVQKYSLVELNSAANLLRAVTDAGISKPTENYGSEIVGCALTSRQARLMMMPIKTLIDSSLRPEREAYLQNPKSYSNEKSFESCAGTCSCGLFNSIVESADEGSLPQGSLKLHARNKQRLTAKASLQSAADRLTCAKKTTWFCGSDLKAYLEKESH